MGETVVEKIFSAHSRDEVAPGRVIWLEIDVRSARDFAGANVVKRFREAYPGERVADPGKTFFTFECNAPANTIAYAQNQQVCRLFAREQGTKVYDVNSGIGSHVLIEEGLAVPGATVVGTDSHLNILGAVGAFGQGMGDVDIAFAFRHGRTWFEVPPTMRVVVTGRYEFPTTAKDLTLALVGRLGARGALGRAVEIVGEQVEALDLASRIALCSMATEMGAIISFLPSGGGPLPGEGGLWPGGPGLPHPGSGRRVPGDGGAGRRGAAPQDRRPPAAGQRVRRGRARGGAGGYGVRGLLYQRALRGHQAGG